MDRQRVVECIGGQKINTQANRQIIHVGLISTSCRIFFLKFLLKDLPLSSTLQNFRMVKATSTSVSQPFKVP